MKNLLMVLLFLISVGTILIGKQVYENKLALKALLAREEFIKYERREASIVDPYEEKNENIQWIYDAISNGNITNPTKMVSEAEMVVTMFIFYGVRPSSIILENHWADNYYTLAKDYGYNLSDLKKRDQLVSRISVAQLITATQGESLIGDSAVQFLFDNRLVTNLYKDKNEYLNKEGMSREEAVALIREVVLNGFYLPQYTSESADKTIVVLGDSISLGWDISKPGTASNYAYPNFIEKNLQGYKVENLAYRGLGTDRLLVNLSKPMIKSKLSRSSLVSLSIGSADLQNASQEFLTSVLQNNGILPTNEQLTMINNEAEKVVTNTERIINEIRSNTDSPILLYNHYNPIPEGIVGNEIANEILNEVNKKIKSLLKSQTDIIYIDSFTAFKGQEKTLLIPNNTHPSINGQKLLARLALDEIKNLGIE